MRTVLGIDTGGTYTDGVIVALESKQILQKAKARTTREDLTIGIKECIDNLNYGNFAKISMVALSTTLATNAIVEGKGCEVGVIMIGEKPMDKLPVEHYLVIDGGHDTEGVPYKQLDEAGLLQALAIFKGKVTAIAISGFCSVRNPEHELRAQELVQQHLRLPVVCGHQLTTTLGFYQRTVTAALNARLLPLIAEWLESIKRVLSSRGIRAPIMIVKSDGSLMDIDTALAKPIETILTGPAASIVGACNLSGQGDAIILDMGGTTTDIAMIKSFSPTLNNEGAVVGGWRTRVRAAEIYTYGLGGDSYIQVTPQKITVGPERVLPLCYAARKYPYLIEELRSGKVVSEISMSYQKTDCLMLVKDSNAQISPQLLAGDQEIISIIRDEPHSIYYIAKRLNVNPHYLNYYSASRLIKSGIVARISITPTDILHVLKEYSLWSCEAAELGVDLLANQLSVSKEYFISRAVEQIARDIAIALIQSLVGMQGDEFNIKENDNNIFVKTIFASNGNEYFNCKVQIPTPVVAIGAPVKAWLPKVRPWLNMDVEIPEHAEVANAFGAATAKLVERIAVVIKPIQYSKGFSVHLPWEYRTFDELEIAVNYATNSAKEWATNHLIKAGSDNPDISVVRRDVVADCNHGGKIFVETVVKIVAVGSPKLN